jgi:chaperonin GroES
MNIPIDKMFGDRLLLKPEKPEVKRKSGIVIPDDSQERPQEAKVLLVGRGKMLDNGEIVPVEAKVGDVVVYSSHAAFVVKYNNEELLIISERDVLAKRKEGK